MRRLLSLAVRLYPSRWRFRYGSELEALLDDMDPSWRDVLDVMKGGAQMRLKGTSPALMAAAFGIVGALVAGAIVVSSPSLFWSKGTMRLTAANESRLDDFVRGRMRDVVGGERPVQPTDLNRIAVIKGRDGTLTVSVGDHDPRKAQELTRSVMTRLTTPQPDRPAIEVVALPDLPKAPARPAAGAAAGAGFGGGALLGLVVALVVRRRSAPAK